MKALFSVASGALLACAPVLAARPTPDEIKPYETAITDAAHWGRLMHDQDQAAWKATDIVFKDAAVRNDKRMRGYITESTAAGIRVVFVGEDNGKLVGLYENTPSSQATFTTDSPARELTADELAAFTARRTASAAFIAPCSDHYNSIVLPEDSGSDRKWRVYLMPGVKDPNIVPFGGYYRYEISADGKTILAQRPFTKSCAMISNSGAKGMPHGFKPAGMMITHLLDPQPTEVHVFVSLTYEQPVIVVTDAWMWKVSGDHIEAFEKTQSEPPAPAKK